jgi:hypothetical protein
MNDEMIKELKKVIYNTWLLNPDFDSIQTCKDFCYDYNIKYNENEIEKIRFEALYDN